MFCPNCGQDSSADQKFCRACGLKLEQVSRLVGEQLPAVTAAQSSPEEIARLLKGKQRAEQVLVGLGITGLTVFVASLILTIIIKLMIGRGQYLQGGAFIAFIAAAAVALTLVFYRESVTEKLAKRGITDDVAPPVAPPTAKLLRASRVEPVPSVTDRTTELLEVKRRRDTREV